MKLMARHQALSVLIGLALLAVIATLPFAGPRPSYWLLGTYSGAWTRSDVVVKLPTEQDPRLFVRIAEFGNAERREAPMIPATPVRWSVLDRQPLRPDQPVHLFINDPATTE